MLVGVLCWLKLMNVCCVCDVGVLCVIRNDCGESVLEIDVVCVRNVVCEKLNGFGCVVFVLYCVMSVLIGSVLSGLVGLMMIECEVWSVVVVGFVISWNSV